MYEEWLRRYYETGDSEALRQLIQHYSPILDRFLAQCVRDPGVRIEIWLRTLHTIRQSRRHPELHFDLQRGTVTGYVFTIAGHLAYRWLVWFEDPRAIS
jgi:hypothetical protein